MRNKILLVFLVCCCSFSMFGQTNEGYAFYIRAISSEFDTEFEENNGVLTYKGKDKELASALENSDVYVFEKAFPAIQEPNLRKVFFGRSENQNLVFELLNAAPHLFEYGEYLGEFSMSLLDGGELPMEFYPNDYGSTGPPGTNSGVDAILDQHDYLETPLAWNRTTGSSNISIGISDTGIQDADADFIGKTTFIGSNIPAMHGTGTAAIAAARGNNSHGIPGVCYECPIIRGAYGPSNYYAIAQLAEAGARVINCSWADQLLCNSHVYSPINQEIINYATSLGAIVVAASGNVGWHCPNPGNVIYYPASYDNVISVATVGHRLEHPIDPADIRENPTDGAFEAFSVKDHVGFGVRFPGNDITVPPVVYKWFTHNLNSKVDILGTGAGVFSYGRYLFNGGVVEYVHGTSSSAPHVTGTIGLMLSLNPCLTFDEVESVLKLSSRNIDYVQANAVFEGNYGSGALQTGKAVEMVYAMMTPGEIVYVRDQVFSRWDFILESAPERIEIENQVFKGSSTAHFKAKQSIELLEGTLLEPSLLTPPSGEGPFVLLEIDPTISICSTTSESMNQFDNSQEKRREISFDLVVVPNPSSGSFKVQIDKELGSFKYQLFDFSGNLILEDNKTNTNSFEIRENNLKQGIYFVKVISKGDTATTKVIIY